MEDVDFLLQNSVQDSFLLFVDSSRRNTEAYPTPSEYTITFDQPFRNVCGVEILDAQIPTTMYNIDKNNDILKYYYVFTAPSAVPPVTTPLVPVVTTPLEEEVCKDNTESLITPSPDTAPEVKVDHNKLLEIVHLNNTFKKIISSQKPSKTYCLVFQVDNADVHEDDPNDRTLPAGVMETQYKFFYVRRLQVHLEFFTEAAKMEKGDNRALGPFSDKGTGKVYYLQYKVEKLHDPDHPVACDMKQIFNDGSIYEYVRRRQEMLYHFEIVNGRAILSFIRTYDVRKEVFQKVAVKFEVDKSLQIMFVSCVHKLQKGNYTNIGFVEEVNNIISTTMVPHGETGDMGVMDKMLLPYIDKTNVSVERQNTITIQTRQRNSRFLLDWSMTTCRGAMGFSSYTKSLDNEFVYKQSMLWPIDNIIIDSIDDGSAGLILTAPGIINLYGRRYVLLRCPELENHIYNSYSYGQNCPGIGLLKLSDPNTISTTDGDFSNLVKKPFHPINNLSRLTFRFQLADGTLYDFKGIEHVLLIAIKFYVPRKKVVQREYLLNPSYNPDYLEYMVGKMNYDTTLKSTPLDRNTIQHAMNEHTKYDFSSDDAEDLESEDGEVNIMSDLVQHALQGRSA